jgi:hypothetical protein
MRVFFVFFINVDFTGLSANGQYYSEDSPVKIARKCRVSVSVPERSANRFWSLDVAIQGALDLLVMVLPALLECKKIS